MNDPKNTIKDALLRQEGLTIGPLTDERRKELEMLLAREQVRAQRMRWVTISLWTLFAAMYVFWAVSGAEGRKFESPLLSALFFLTVALFPVAVLSSISYYLRRQCLNRKDIDFRLRKMEDQIARLRH